jgi:hypothetical protein
LLRAHRLPVGTHTYAYVCRRVCSVQAQGEHPVENVLLAIFFMQSMSIGGDLNIDDKGSEQNFEPLQSLHHSSIGYQSMQPELTSPRRLIPTSAIENNNKNEVDAI